MKEERDTWSEDDKLQYVPQTGDIIFVTEMFGSEAILAILEKTTKNSICYYCSYRILNCSFDSSWWSMDKSLINELRPATKEEKKLFLNKMKEAGYQWNAKRKKIESTRWRPKAGDIIFESNKNNPKGLIAIFDEEKSHFVYDNSSDYYTCINNYCSYNIAEDCISTHKSSSYKRDIKKFRPATKKEKKLLFDKLKASGYCWNKAYKRVGVIRWRAKVGELYYYINMYGEVCSKIDVGEGYHPYYSGICDEDMYFLGNYYKTEELAEKKASQIKALYKIQ